MQDLGQGAILGKLRDGFLVNQLLYCSIGVWDVCKAIPIGGIGGFTNIVLDFPKVCTLVPNQIEVHPGWTISGVLSLPYQRWHTKEPDYSVQYSNCK
jgi:hypothetical protein